MFPASGAPGTADSSSRRGRGAEAEEEEDTPDPLGTYEVHEEEFPTTRKETSDVAKGSGFSGRLSTTPSFPPQVRIRGAVYVYSPA